MNQRFPSGPAVRSAAVPPEESAYSVTTPEGHPADPPMRPRAGSIVKRRRKPKVAVGTDGQIGEIADRRDRELGDDARGGDPANESRQVESRGGRRCAEKPEIAIGTDDQISRPSPGESGYSVRTPEGVTRPILPCKADALEVRNGLGEPEVAIGLATRSSSRMTPAASGYSEITPDGVTRATNAEVGFPDASLAADVNQRLPSGSAIRLVAGYPPEGERVLSHRTGGGHPANPP